jgi:hypothetical protein
VQANTATFRVGTATPGFYGESEYTQVEFTLGCLISRKGINTTGYGSVISVGLESSIDDSVMSIQEINVLALLGKTV